MKLTQDTQEKLFLLGLAGVALYFIAKKASDLTAPVANVIADAYSAIVLPGDVRVLGVIILPNGNQIPVNGLNIDAQARFTYQSQRYQLTGRDSFNRYVAVRI